MASVVEKEGRTEICFENTFESSSVICSHSPAKTGSGPSNVLVQFPDPKLTLWKCSWETIHIGFGGSRACTYLNQSL